MSTFLHHLLPEDDIPPMHERCLVCGAVFPEWFETCPECAQIRLMHDKADAQLADLSATGDDAERTRDLTTDADFRDAEQLRQLRRAMDGKDDD